MLESHARFVRTGAGSFLADLIREGAFRLLAFAQRVGISPVVGRRRDQAAVPVDVYVGRRSAAPDQINPLRAFSTRFAGRQGDVGRGRWRRRF